ncbi:MAG: RNA-binding protein [Candidatus Aminicenantales bacterium]
MTGNKVYIGNLYLRASKNQIRDLLVRFGNVKNVEYVEGSGYAYVEMETEEEAERARIALDGTEFLERVIKVK